MCTWEEERMVRLALESSKGFVDRYVVVDKASQDGTVEAILECVDKWGLNMDIYVEPDLSLQDAVMFGIDKIDEDWLLIQDGDEVFHTDGPNSIFTLRKLLRLRNVVFYTPMTVLVDDFLHTVKRYTKETVGVHQPPHPFLYHNNETFSRGSKFFPNVIGVRVYLQKVYKFNCRVKSPKRMFLRLMFWKNWSGDVGLRKEYKSVEEYAQAMLGPKNLDFEAEKWREQHLKATLLPYNEKLYGYYPKVIRKQMGLS